MRFKKICKKVAFPHVAVITSLIPVSAAFLTYSLINIKTTSPVAIFSYLLSFYTLAVCCLRFNRIIILFKNFKNRNRYIKRWNSDVRFRVNLSLTASLTFNALYAVFQFLLGVRYASLWYFSMSAYYVTLSVMRFFLVRHTVRHTSGENAEKEWIKYRACGIVFLVMNLVLTVIIFFMVYQNKTFHHHEITAIAMATYTFCTMASAVSGIIKYKKYGSPVYSASRAISLAAACVSMLTLENTMLTAFGGDTTTAEQRRIFLGLTGGAISLFIISMAIYIIVQSNKKLKLIKNGE